MGYEYKEYKIYASVSRHNSDKDTEHDALWEEVIKKIEEIVEDPKYTEITLMSGL